MTKPIVKGFLLRSKSNTMKNIFSIQAGLRTWLFLLFVLTLTAANAQNTGCNAQFNWQRQPGSMSVYFVPTQQNTVATYSWNFGDGSPTVNVPNPQHLYLQPGTYVACLTITAMTATGTTCTAQWCDSVFVGTNTSMCNANFTWTNTSASNTVQFSPALNPTGSIYQWNFGDGTTSNQLAPSHQFPSGGSYNVCLTVTNGTCTTTYCDSVFTNSVAVNCDAHFAFQFGQQPNSVYFAPAPNPQVAIYRWTFGDGDSSSMRNPGHIYTQPGNYLVCLTVTVPGVNGGVQCTASWCDSVIITQVPNPCDARFSWGANNLTQTVGFRPQLIINTATYAWNFGDGSTSNLATPTHQYAQPGMYWVCLTVSRISTAGNVCTDTWCDSVRVNVPLPPVCNANFNFVRQFNQPNTFRFVTMTMSPGTTYFWTFGDGDTSSMRTPIHTYADTGVYQVCLIVSTVNSAGSCSDTVCRTIVVRPPVINTTRCRAFFNFQPVPATPRALAFYNLSTGTPSQFLWNFGDSTFSNQPNPVHQFPRPGIYNVCLSISDSATQCQSRFCQIIYIGPNNMPIVAADDSEFLRLQDDKPTFSVALFPNPADDYAQIVLNGTQGNASFELYDTSGRMVKSLNGLGDGTTDLPFVELGSGLYFYRILESNQLLTQGKLLVR
jgi:PKD repeat protein